MKEKSIFSQIIDREIPEDITNITMSYTFFELLSNNHYYEHIQRVSNKALVLDRGDLRVRVQEADHILNAS